jgi:glucosamine--fructose-6-phosphate aminotransferase (isomerizing)
MAEQKSAVTTPLFENILAQPDALHAVLDRQSGEGRGGLLQAAEVLCGCSKIVLTGMGASLFACGPLRYLLAAGGMTVSSVEAAELLYFLGGNLDSDTGVVLVSRSGESVEVLKLLDVLEARGCKTVGVANVADSSLLGRAQTGVLLGSPADQLVAIQTYVATVTVLLLLGAACKRKLDQALDRGHHAVEILRTFVPACVEASTGWSDFISDSPLYFLGRGPSLATVDEGVLLMHETAKSPAMGMSVAQFRHGPVEVAGPSVRAVVLGTAAATSPLDLQLASDLAGMGVVVRWIGPGSDVKALAPWPGEVHELLRPLFEVVPLQLLAYRTAEARGVTPGDFRWAPAITSSESGFPALT